MGLVDALLLQVLGVLDQLVGLGLGIGELGVLVGLGIVDYGLGLLLGSLNGLESLDDILGGGLGVLDLDVHHSQADVVLVQDLGDQSLDLHLDVLLAVGEDGVHGGGADHISDLALDQVTQDLGGIVACVEVADGVGDLILDEEIHIDDVVVAGDHAGLIGDGLVGAGAVAQLQVLVDVDVDLLHLLDAEGELEVEARVGNGCDLAEGGDHRLLLVVNGVEAA